MQYSIDCDVCLYLSDKASEHFIFENVNDQWMGVSLSSQYNSSTGSFLVRNFYVCCFGHLVSCFCQHCTVTLSIGYKNCFFCVVYWIGSVSTDGVSSHSREE